MRDGSFEVGDRDPPPLERGIGSLRGDPELEVPFSRSKCPQSVFGNNGMEFSTRRWRKSFAGKDKEGGRKAGTNGRTVTSWVNAAWRKVTGVY